jgi:hypothetical protein
MSTITVSTFDIPNWQLGGSACTLRILSNQSFRTSAGSQINRSTKDVFYQSVACTISGTVVSVPSFTIDSTTDASDPNATYNAALYDSNGIKRQVVYPYSLCLRLSESGSSSGTYRRCRRRDVGRHRRNTVQPDRPSGRT